MFYITTPIYYVNGKPHIGSFYTTLIADVISRYKRYVKKEEVFFLTGTDEHGLKVYKAAQERGIDVKQHCDEYAQRFKDAWSELNIEYDRFIRTTDPDHEKVVKEVINKLYEQGDIYKSTYTGNYCISCENFVTEDTNTCPDCGKELISVTEENYFFKLSKYAPRLKKYIEENPDFIQPEFRKNEVLSRLNEEIKDISITRSKEKVPWGIEVDFDNTQVIYVWFDALLNYISGIGYLNNEELFNKFWPADYHLLGKDIIWFHCVIWPSMLMALDLPLPKHILAHGWWLVKGDKMSKSKGNVMDPLYLKEKYNLDAVRYYLLRDVQIGQDGNFDEVSLVEKFNGEVINNWSNLINRTLSQLKKFFNFEFEPFNYSLLTEEERKLLEEFKNEVEKLIKQIDELYEKLEFQKALININQISILANKLLARLEPWAVAKTDRKNAALIVLLYALEAARIVAVFYSGICLQGVEKAFEYLGGVDLSLEFNPEKLLDKQLKKGKVLYKKLEFGE